MQDPHKAMMAIFKFLVHGAKNFTGDVKISYLCLGIANLVEDSSVMQI
jgi:hypothetical protein